MIGSWCTLHNLAVTWVSGAQEVQYLDVVSKHSPLHLVHTRLPLSDCPSTCWLLTDAIPVNKCLSKISAAFQSALGSPIWITGYRPLWCTHDYIIKLSPSSCQMPCVSFSFTYMSHTSHCKNFLKLHLQHSRVRHIHKSFTKKKLNKEQSLSLEWLISNTYIHPTPYVYGVSFNKEDTIKADE